MAIARIVISCQDEQTLFLLQKYQTDRRLAAIHKSHSPDQLPAAAEIPADSLETILPALP